MCPRVAVRSALSEISSDRAELTINTTFLGFNRIYIVYCIKFGTLILENMNTLKVLVCFFLFVNVSSAQFGASVRYSQNTAKNWNSIYQTFSEDETKLFDSGLEFGLNYWFRLKNYRVEFLPEISYASLKSENLVNVRANSHALTSYNFNFNVQIYALDFEGDCNCPTWSKDGDLIKKGFYWLLSPGISKHNISSKFLLEDENIEDTSITSFRLGAGLGLDIGINDFLTVSPFAIYNINFGNNWENQTTTYDSSLPSENNSSSINQLQVGMRVIFRPDYKGF